MKRYINRIIGAAATFLIAAIFLTTTGLLSENNRRAAAQVIQPPAFQTQNPKIYFEQNRGQFDAAARFVSRGAAGENL